MPSLATSSASADALSTLVSNCTPRKHPAVRYLGEILPEEAFAYLQQNGGMLVDVRTIPEWYFVGKADLSGCKGALVEISWKVYPEMDNNPNFASLLAETGATHDTPLFFICRSGGRSAAAATAMADLGYRYCFNVYKGFEGDENAAMHRGHVNGWQGTGLPWTH